jgi:hypothetical protein
VGDAAGHGDDAGGRRPLGGGGLGVEDVTWCEGAVGEGPGGGGGMAVDGTVGGSGTFGEGPRAAARALRVEFSIAAVLCGSRIPQTNHACLLPGSSSAGCVCA